MSGIHRVDGEEEYEDGGEEHEEGQYEDGGGEHGDWI